MPALAFSPCRYMAQSKHAEARELMCSGALLFFSHGQVSRLPGAREGPGAQPGLSAPVSQHQCGA